jgi:hypothetical protein
MKLDSYLQSQLERIELGGTPKAAEELEATARASARQAAEDLKQVQRTNSTFFLSLWVLMILAFIATFVVALMYRHEMGGLAVVLGSGGVVQGGLLLRLSHEYRQKAYIDLVVTLSQRLPPKELRPILQQILDLLRKDVMPPAELKRQPL